MVLLDAGLHRLGLDPGLGGVVHAAGQVAVGVGGDRRREQIAHRVPVEIREGERRQRLRYAAEARANCLNRHADAPGGEGSDADHDQIGRPARLEAPDCRDACRRRQRQAGGPEIDRRQGVPDRQQLEGPAILAIGPLHLLGDHRQKFELNQ